MTAIDKLRRVGGVVLLVKGLFGLLLPRQYIALNLRLILPGFENPGDLKPKGWYVETVRALAAGMVATGIVSLIQSTRDTADSSVDPISIPTDEGDANEADEAGTGDTA